MVVSDARVTIIENAENVTANGRTARRGCGLTPDAVERRFTAGVDRGYATAVDHQTESIGEKQIVAGSVAGRPATAEDARTQVTTMNAGMLPGGPAHVTDVGMTGHDAGPQGYDSGPCVAGLRDRMPSVRDGAFDDASATPGEVVVNVDPGISPAIERCDPHPGGTA